MRSMTEAGRRMDKDDRTGSSVRLVGSSGAGGGASALVVPMGFGRERLADMKRASDQPTRGGAGDCFGRIGLGLRRRIEKGYFGNFTKYRLGDLWLNRGAGRRMEKRFRSIEDEDGALRCVRVLTHLCVGLNGCPNGISPRC